MARRRHAVNPAKVKATATALDAHPPAELFRPRLNVQRRLSVALLSLLGAVLLSVSFAPFDCWCLAYVALVPWVLALSTQGLRRWALLCAWAAGLLFWLANLYWLWWITLVGYGFLCVYLSAYWLVAALVVRSALRRNWPMWVVLPVTWVALEYARAYVISGFPWFYLAHSQYAQTRLIQVADLTGQYGVSFFVAMVNGALVDLLNGPLFVPRGGGARMGRQKLIGAGACAAAAAGLIGYGTWRLGQQTRSPGPVIGVCQQAFPVSLTRPPATHERVLNSYLEAADRFAGAGCDLVLIPESMLPPGVNADFLTLDLSGLSAACVMAMAQRVFPPEDRAGRSDRRLLEEYYLPYLRQQAQRVGRTSRRLGCPILAGAVALRPNPSPVHERDQWLRLNSALWFDATSPAGPDDPELWRSSPDYYSKVHLVPFGEYVPFKRSWPGLHRLLRWFVPAVMEQLEPGNRQLIYRLERPAAPRAAGAASVPSTLAALPADSQPASSATTAPGPADRPWRLAVPICYEGTFARVCRAMVRGDGRKSIDILVNLSNDGWFVWQMASGRVHRSTEHAQHLAHYCFRAVENRVPVVRAVNTGISAYIDPDGRIRAELRQGKLRSMIAGNLLLDGREAGQGEFIQHGPLVLVDSRVTVYSLWGDVFALLAAAGGIGMAGYLLLRRPGAVEGAGS